MVHAESYAQTSVIFNMFGEEREGMRPIAEWRKHKWHVVSRATGTPAPHGWACSKCHSVVLSDVKPFVNSDGKVWSQKQDETQPTEYSADCEEAERDNTVKAVMQS